MNFFNFKNFLVFSQIIKNTDNVIKLFVLKRSTKNILGQKISYRSKIFDLRTTYEKTCNLETFSHNAQGTKVMSWRSLKISNELLRALWILKHLGSYCDKANFFIIMIMVENYIFVAEIPSEPKWKTILLKINQKLSVFS